MDEVGEVLEETLDNESRRKCVPQQDYTDRTFPTVTRILTLAHNPCV